MNKSRLLCTFSTFFSLFLATTVQAAAVSGQGTWETTLQGRDLDGNPATFEAYYDTTLNITWLADANVLVIPALWADANSWAVALNINGVTGWRLPDTAPVDGVAFDYTPLFDGSSDRFYNISAPGTIYAGSTGSEMAHMFYNTLGNLANFDTSGSSPQPGGGLTNTGPFSNIQSTAYWSATAYAPGPLYWYFNFGAGDQGDVPFDNLVLFAWAVRDGDVAPPDTDGDSVPDPTDACPGTPAGEPVDGNGCSITQLCPCDGPTESNAPWGSHGQYVSCVEKNAKQFVRDDLLSRTEKRGLVREAAKSNCGRSHSGDSDSGDSDSDDSGHSDSDSDSDSGIKRK